MCRLKKGKTLRKERDIKEVKDSIHLIRSPAAGKSSLSLRALHFITRINILASVVVYNNNNIDSCIAQ